MRWAAAVWTAWAWSSPAWAADIDASGRVEAHARVAINGCWPTCGYVDFHDAAVVGGSVRADFDRRVRAVLAADVRAHATSDLQTVEDSGSITLISPVSLKLKEASIGAFGVAAPWLDFGTGVRTLHWGVADGITLVNNLNPYDLEDPTRFDGRLAVPMVAINAHPGPVIAEAAWAPFFTPAALPTDQVDVLAGARDVFDVGGANATDVRSLDSITTVPPTSLANSSVSGRVAVQVPRADIAVSWFHGRDSLPQVDGTVLLTGFATNSDRVDVGVPVTWPRIDVGGLEARGELPWEIGGWVEAAIVLPERTEAALSEGQLTDLVDLGALDEVPDPIPTTVTQDGNPYARWIVGLDRSTGRFYVNVQWLHGFPTERQLADLHDYGMLAVRVTLADHWVLSLRGVSDGAGYLGGAEIVYLHGDAAEISLGGVWIDGPEGSALRGFRAVSNVGLGTVVRF